MSIGADHLEGTMMAKIKERMCSSEIPQKLARLFAAKVNKKTNSPGENLSLIDKEIQTVKNQIQGLIRLAERTEKMEEIADRLTELDARRKQLEIERDNPFPLKKPT